MTIKKRLFISNILMIVIPVIVSFAALWVCFSIINAFYDGALIELMRENRGFRPPQRDDYRTMAYTVGLVAIVSLVVIICITNLLLTKFVFNKIKQPLQMLSDGVRQISDGNLDYKIVYRENDEFLPICDDFNGMAIRLKDSTDDVLKNEQNRKELLAGISHDLRSPLTSIKAYVEGLLEGVADTPESQVEYLQTIRQKTDVINNMVSQLFFYSKMDMGNYPTKPELLSVTDEIADFVAASREDYEARGLRIDVSGLQTGSVIFADPLQLRSVIANILDNSAKYKNKETACARVACAESGGTVSIVFEDDGPGVPPAALPHIFNVFYRSDPSRNNPDKGSGLGLAIASKAVERMTGRIYARNIDGGGLRIIIEIPEGGAKQSEENPDY